MFLQFCTHYFSIKNEFSTPEKNKKYSGQGLSPFCVPVVSFRNLSSRLCIILSFHAHANFISTTTKPLPDSGQLTQTMTDTASIAFNTSSNHFDQIAVVFIEHSKSGDDDLLKAVKAVTRESRYYDTEARTEITKYVSIQTQKHTCVPNICLCVSGHYIQTCIHTCIRTYTNVHTHIHTQPRTHMWSRHLSMRVRA